VRTGVQALSLLSSPLNVRVLTALADEPLPLSELRDAVGSPPQTTMRGHVRTLTECGVLERRRNGGFPGPTELELTSPGRGLLTVAEALHAWLDAAPKEALTFGGSRAKDAIKALIGGWQSNIVRALAPRPLSLTELDRALGGIDYPSIQRRLTALNRAGQVRAIQRPGRATPYAITDWLRRGISPLVVAARWEQRHAGDAAPVVKHDVEAAFLLAIPLLALSSDLFGTCRLAVELPDDDRSRQVGVLISVEHGQVVSCVSRLEGPADASAAGSPAAWLTAIVEDELAPLELTGEFGLAAEVLDGLRQAAATASQKKARDGISAAGLTC
jgi:DNA-binding HxlR family transcriptional regulator